MTHADAKPRPAKFTIVETIKRRAMSRPLEASTNDAAAAAAADDVPGPGPLADTTATVNLGSESAAADIKFPLCDAAVGKREGSEWELADAILAESSEPGENGVRNGSNATMEAMRDEIAKNHGVDLSLERIRKLRKVASAFPPGRRRPAVSIEGHLEAGTPEALDAFFKSAPEGTALTRAMLRQLKYPTEKAEEAKQADERRHQEADHQKALQDLCRHSNEKTSNWNGQRRSTSSAIRTPAAPSTRSLNRFPRRCHQRQSQRSPLPKTLSRVFVGCCCHADSTPQS